VVVLSVVITFLVTPGSMVLKLVCCIFIVAALSEVLVDVKSVLLKWPAVTGIIVVTSLVDFDDIVVTGAGVVALVVVVQSADMSVSIMLLLAVSIAFTTSLEVISAATLGLLGLAPPVSGVVDGIIIVVSFGFTSVIIMLTVDAGILVVASFVIIVSLVIAL